jgi:nitroreductase
VLELTPDELLTTTRTVRKRLDLSRPVPRALVEECLAVALQAPNGSNANSWRWIAVDDRATIRELARLYNQGLDDFIATFGERGYDLGANVPGFDRIGASTQHLRDHFHELPAVLVPLVAGRTDGRGAHVFYQASLWGSIVQAIWSFMLALRARGLGSAWTTGHLWREREVAQLLGIPHEQYMQAGLFPVAYTLGTKFEPAWRKPVAEVLRWI